MNILCKCIQAASGVMDTLEYCKPLTCGVSDLILYVIW